MRYLKFAWQRLTRGWDDRELWNLDHALAKHVLPRLRRFAATRGGYPADLDNDAEWQVELDRMIAAFEFIAADDWVLDEPAYVQEGLDLFAKRFRWLWI